MPKDDIAGEAFRNARWAALPPLQTYPGPIFEQHSLLARFIPKTKCGSAIEIGCVPGNWLVYLHKEYGYSGSGIDYSEHLEYVRHNLALNGIHPEALFHADLFSFAPPKL
jgi:hypothetical protein